MAKIKAASAAVSSWMDENSKKGALAAFSLGFLIGLIF